jgi:hypothetical protein
MKKIKDFLKNLLGIIIYGGILIGIGFGIIYLLFRK